MPRLVKTVDVASLSPEEQTKIFLYGNSKNTSKKETKYIMPEKVLATYINRENPKHKIEIEYMTKDVMNDLIKKQLDYCRLKTIISL